MPEDATDAGTNSIRVLLVVVYAVLLILVFYGSFRVTHGRREFAAVTTIAVTAVSAVMGAIISFLSLRSTQNASTRLEGVKAELQKEISSAKIWTDMRFEHEKRKAAEEREAYSKLWTAIDLSYQLLAKLEGSDWKTEDKVSMDGALLAARAYLLYVRQSDHEALWEKASQRAVYIAEEAAKTKASDQPTLWRTEVCGFSDIHSQLEHVTREEMRRLPPTGTSA